MTTEWIAKRSLPRPDVLLQQLRIVEIERDALREKCERAERERDEMESMLSEEVLPKPTSIRGRVYSYLMDLPDATNAEMFSVLGISRDSPGYGSALKAAAQVRLWMFGRRINRKSPDIHYFCKTEIFAIMGQARKRLTNEDLYDHLGIARKHCNSQSINAWAQMWREGEREIRRKSRV